MMCWQNAGRGRRRYRSRLDGEASAAGVDRHPEACI